MAEFESFGKIPRLNRDCTITEKLNGTNACLIIPEDGSGVFAQSRKRLITPTDDNFGFAKWAQDNAGLLMGELGPGRHFGEWVGPGIQSNPYGLAIRVFALFNTSRWGDIGFGFFTEHGGAAESAFVQSVPVLYEGPFSTKAVEDEVEMLRACGSQFAPGSLGYAEGVIVYHHAANQMFKVTLENDEKPKGYHE